MKLVTQSGRMPCWPLPQLQDSWLLSHRTWMIIENQTNTLKIRILASNARIQRNLSILRIKRKFMVRRCSEVYIHRNAFIIDGYRKMRDPRCRIEWDRASYGNRR